MHLFLGPTAIAITIILTEILLKVYRECSPDTPHLRHGWVDTTFGLVVVICSYLMSLGIGIKVANYLFG